MATPVLAFSLDQRRLKLVNVMLEIKRLSPRHYAKLRRELLAAAKTSARRRAAVSAASAGAS